MGRTVGYSHGFEHVEGEYYLALEESQEGDWTETIASRFTSDQPQEEYPWLGQLMKFIRFTGERPTQQLRDDKLVIVNEDWTMNLEIAEKDWRRDKTGQTRARAGEMALATSEHSMELLSALIIANPTAYDGVAFYHASGHVVGGFTIKNALVAGDGLAGGSTPTAVQQASNIQVLLQQILGFKGDQGRSINRRAKSFALMIPTNMMAATGSALGDAYFAGGVTNPIPGLLKAQGFKIELIVNSDLDAAATNNQMHLFRTDGKIKPFIYQEELLELKGLGLESEWCYMHKTVRFDADLTCGAGPGRFELAVRGVLA